MEHKTDKHIIKELRAELKKVKTEKDDLELVIDNLPGHVYWLDKNLVIQGCNRNQATAAKLNHWKEIKGIKLEDMNFGCDREVINKTNRSVLKHNKMIIQEEFGSNENGKRLFLSEKKPLKNKKGKTVGLVGISLDITEMKDREKQLEQAKLRAELTEQKRFAFLTKLRNTTIGQTTTKPSDSIETLKEIIDYLENIIARMPGHVFWIDRNNNFLGCNNNQAKDIGLKSRHEIIGKTISDFQNSDNTKKIVKLNNKIMDSGRRVAMEETGFLPDGKTVGIYLSFKDPIIDKSNKVVGLLGISLNITKQKQTEQELKIAKEMAEKANIAKTEFIANISHDIRTPLSGIIGLTRIIQKKPTSKKNASYAQNIDNASHRLLSILNAVIEFSKIETGIFPITKNCFNLKDMLVSTASVFNDQHHKFDIKYPNGIPRYIITDNIRLNRIVMNLLNNAIKFTEKGIITTKVKIETKSKTKANLELSISDTGMGIPEDKLQTIFDRFSRIESSYTTNKQGTGLGLSIVKRFIDELNGEIFVNSQVGVGSTFTCHIPIKLPSKKVTTKKQPTSKPIITKPNKTLKILLIEDDEICQLTEKVQLEDLGHKVDIASNGKQALNKINSLYDVIISDIGLPDIDGIELAKKIRSGESPNNKTPIISLSAHIYSKLSNDCKKAGIDYVISKPLDTDTINDALAKTSRKNKKSNK
ncbi:MAG: response regulator [Gammaproteobacteria bacterium]|nr:response regulator [Gammaproteobacteria bacterium]